MTTNPFRQPLPTADILLNQKVWIATAKGTDASSGRLKLIANSEYLWFGDLVSVPLAWVEVAEPLGPGFVVGWRNSLTNRLEVASFCVRTFFGYDTARRDSLIITIRDLAERAAAAPAPTAQAAATSPRCDRCGDPATRVLDLVQSTNFLLHAIDRTDRHVWCETHARSAQRRSAVRNILSGSFGLPGVFTTPFLIHHQTDLLSWPERVALLTLAAVPFALLLWFIVAGIMAAL